MAEDRRAPVIDVVHPFLDQARCRSVDEHDRRQHRRRGFVLHGGGYLVLSPSTDLVGWIVLPRLPTGLGAGPLNAAAEEEGPRRSSRDDHVSKISFLTSRWV